METTLAHEQQVSILINQLYELATRESDYPTQAHLQTFITEQIEEEKAAADIISKVNLIGENDSNLLLLDNEMAARQVSPGL